MFFCFKLNSFIVFFHIYAYVMFLQWEMLVFLSYFLSVIRNSYLFLSDTRFQYLQKRHCLEKRSGISSLPGTGSIQMVLDPTGLLAQDTGKPQVQINPSLLRAATGVLASRRLWFSMSEKHLKETRLIGLCMNTALLMSIDLQRRRAA